MPKLPTLVAPAAIAATGLVAIAGCSSSSSGTQASGSPATSVQASGTAAAPPSTAASSSAPAASSASASTAPGAVITPLARKLGCADPVATKPQASAGAALGAESGINCQVAGIQYVLLQLAPDGSANKAAKGLLTAAGTRSGTVYYVSGPRWFAVGGPASTNTPPTRQDAQAVQAKIGGTIGSASA